MGTPQSSIASADLEFAFWESSFETFLTIRVPRVRLVNRNGQGFDSWAGSKHVPLGFLVEFFEVKDYAQVIRVGSGFLDGAEVSSVGV